MAEADIITDNSNRQWIGVKTLFREKNLIKQVPGARYDSEMQLWKVPLSYVGAVQLSNVFGVSLDVSTTLTEWAGLAFQSRDLARTAAQQTDASLTHPRAAELSPLQRVGAAFIATTNAILADEMGSGKTVQACVALHEMSAYRTLVICPNSVKRSWEKHTAEWTTAAPYMVYGSAKQRAAVIDAFNDHDGPAVLIMNYEQLRAHSRLAPYGNIALTEKERELKELNHVHFDVIIADEAHRIKNPKSKQTRALWALTADHRIAMTGTPIGNHPGDLWSVLHFVDPVDWPSRTQYIDRYCVVQWNPFGGSDITGVRFDKRDEFYSILDTVMLRRLKSEIMSRTIKKNAIVRYVTLLPKHRKMYNQFRDELIARIEEGLISAVNPLAATTRLVQLSAAMLREAEDGTIEMIEPSPKIDELMELIEELEGQQVVVYSASKRLLHLAQARLEEAGIPHGVITGDTDSARRGELVELFQAGKFMVMLATTGAAGEGITLTAAKTLVFLQRSWSMLQNAQAEDRIHRWGQEADEVDIVDIISEDTIDERVYDVHYVKRGRLDEVTRDSLKELL